jgi:hypothetical protein
VGAADTFMVVIDTRQGPQVPQILALPVREC